MKVEINQIKTKPEKTNKMKSWFFEEKVGKLLATKRGPKYTRNERVKVVTDTT